MKYKCSLPDASNANDKNRITAWRKHWPSQPKNSKQATGQCCQESIDGPKSMLNKPEIKPFDPRHDLRAPLDLQARAEKVIDEINHVEKITSDDLIQSASRAAKIPLLNIKQYMRNNVSLYMETLQCWHARSSGECSKLPSCAWKTRFVSHAEMKQLVLMISLPTCHTCRVKWFHGR